MAIMQPSATRSETDPSAYPLVRIGDEEYELRYRHRDIMRLKKSGINLAAKLSGEQLIEHLPLIISAGLSHLGSQAPSLNVIETFIGDLDIGELSVYTLAFIEAQKKASATATAATTELKRIAKENRRELAEDELPPTIN